MPTSDIGTRFTLLESGETFDSFAREVREGLTAQPKKLSFRHFYDQRGSKLFEAISRLPEYYLTRAEKEILQARAPHIAALMPQPVTLVELGSGSADKTRLLIEALLESQSELLFAHVDISPKALEESSQALLKTYDCLEVLGVAATYEEGLARLREEIEGPSLILWLGSSVGNFEPDEAIRFLQRLALSMDREGDRLLIGMDLHKSQAVLEKAYDDTQGITAAFNLNLLARINRELGGGFDLDLFIHCARYNEAKGRVEMHLISREAHKVRIGALDLEISFAAGETIHTESCHKYRLSHIESFLGQAGFCLEHKYLDAAGRFSLNLARPELQH